MPEYGFYIGVLLYAVLGSGIAFALGEQTIRGAFFAGITAPALITNAITGAQDVRIQAGSGQKTSSSIFASYARADGDKKVDFDAAWKGFTPEQLKSYMLSVYR